MTTSFPMSCMTVSTSSSHPGGILRQTIPRWGSIVVNVAIPSYPSSMNRIRWIFLRSTRKYFVMVFNVNLLAQKIVSRFYPMPTRSCLARPPSASPHANGGRLGWRANLRGRRVGDLASLFQRFSCEGDRSRHERSECG